MIDVLNRQRTIRIDTERWRAFTQRALKALPTDSQSVAVAFVSDRTMRQLNHTWRGKRGTTDVLSFPSEQTEFEKNAESTLGDVVISIERAKKQARQNGLTLNLEISQLILHGLLHLCGYDHETDNGEMNRLEIKLRKKLAIME